MILCCPDHPPYALLQWGKEEIETFTVEKRFDDFCNDRLLQLAIETEFEIIGEALSRLERLDSEDLKTKIPARDEACEIGDSEPHV